MSKLQEILKASASGDAERVEELLKLDPRLANAKDKQGATALIQASAAGLSTTQGHTDVVKLLLKHGARPNVKTSDGATALGIAAERGAGEICEILLMGGAELTIHSAAALGMLPEMKSMLRVEPELANEKDEYRGATPLYYAAQQDQKEAARMLLEYEAAIDMQTPLQGNTAMHIAAAAPAEGTLELLISEQGDVNARNYNRQTPLHWAMEEWRSEGSRAVLLLIEHGADVNARDDQKVTPLGKALARNKTHLVEILHKHKARE